MKSPQAHKLLRSQVEETARSLVDLLSSQKYRSFDYMDWWSTAWGRAAKQFAYQTEPVGNILFSLPILSAELWLPFLRRPLGIQPQVAPIVVAQHGLAALELFRASSDDAYLQIAAADAAKLLELPRQNVHELAWGFPFKWSNNQGIIPWMQPAYTQTAYVFDLFEQLWIETRSDKYQENMQTIVSAMEKSYITVEKETGLANTYFSEGIGDFVINAMTYRLAILASASAHGHTQAQSTISGLIEYLISQQNADGSWFYGESSKNQFIDHYHTCFVIKNLTRANSFLKNDDIDQALENGLAYYWRELFYENGLPKPFSARVRLNIVEFDLYDFAECLNLFALLGPDHAFELPGLRTVLEGLEEHLSSGGGRLHYRKYRLPSVRRYSYFRNGVSAAMLAFAKLNNAPILRDAILIGNDENDSN